MISHRLLLKMKKGGGGGGEGDALSARLRPRDSGGGMFGDVEEEEGDDESLDAWMAARMPLEGKASRRRRRKAKRAEGGAVWAAGNDDEINETAKSNHRSDHDDGFVFDHYNPYLYRGRDSKPLFS
mmetsp:Transcript_434/g.650  ORF Transcript_434/g.650 Transcript_434/m.650 type:complete len:126 (+) Transcript_434:539-916(+)